MLTDSVRGHLVSFYFVPIQGAPEFAHGMKLRSNDFTPGSPSAARLFPLDAIVDRSRLPRLNATLSSHKFLPALPWPPDLLGVGSHRRKCRGPAW